MQLLFIEGIPGSGKTTLAEYVYDVLSNSDIESAWYLEESKQHPVHSRAVRDFSDSPLYPKLCLESWEQFIDREKNTNTVHVMEGSAFQSTIRFMMEHEIDGIPEYFEQFMKLVEPLSPAFLYLRPNDAIELSRLISKLRGDDWATKVSRYETNISYSINHNLKGLEGMHIFWSKYAELCDALISKWKGPKKIIKFEPGKWDTHKMESQSFIRSLGLRLDFQKNTG